MMERFLNGNSTGMRLARTIVQGIIGVLIAYLDTLVGQAIIIPEMRPVVVALVMAILSPVMAELGRINEKGEEPDGEEDTK